MTGEKVLKELARVLRATCGENTRMILTAHELAMACEVAADRVGYEEWEEGMGDSL